MRGCRRWRRRTISTSSPSRPMPRSAKERGCAWPRRLRPADTTSTTEARMRRRVLRVALTGMLSALPIRAGAAPTSSRPMSRRVTARACRTSICVGQAPASSRPQRRWERWRAKARRGESRLASSPRAILPAFVPLGALSLDLDRLGRNAAQPFEPSREVSALPGNGRSGAGHEALTSLEVLDLAARALEHIAQFAGLLGAEAPLRILAKSAPRKPWIASPIPFSPIGAEASSSWTLIASSSGRWLASQDLPASVMVKRRRGPCEDEVTSPASASILRIG